MVKKRSFAEWLGDGAKGVSGKIDRIKEDIDKGREKRLGTIQTKIDLMKKENELDALRAEKEAIRKKTQPDWKMF